MEDYLTRLRVALIIYFVVSCLSRVALSATHLELEIFFVVAVVGFALGAVEAVEGGVVRATLRLFFKGLEFKTGESLHSCNGPWPPAADTSAAVDPTSWRGTDLSFFGTPTISWILRTIFKNFSRPSRSIMFGSLTSIVETYDELIAEKSQAPVAVSYEYERKRLP